MEAFDAGALHLQHLQTLLTQPQMVQALASGLSAEAALNHLNASPLPFVPADALPKGQAYESFIFEQQSVPTRDNLHDFFGGLMWCQLPQLKTAMNRLQAGEIARDGASAKRSALRNAVTLLDESGLLLDAPDAIWQALQMRQWQRALLDLRPQWKQVRYFLLGHGLLEQLSLQSHWALTAHTLRVDVAAAQGNWDAAACSALQSQVLPRLNMGQKPYIPLPVFGIPGWHAGNTQAAFYDQQRIFRPLPHAGSAAAST